MSELLICRRDATSVICGWPIVMPSGIQNRYPAGATDLNVYEKTPDFFEIQLGVQNFGYFAPPQHRDAHMDKGKPVFIDPHFGKRRSGPIGFDPE